MRKSIARDWRRSRVIINPNKKMHRLIAVRFLFHLKLHYKLLFTYCFAYGKFAVFNYGGLLEFVPKNSDFRAQFAR